MKKPLSFFAISLALGCAPAGELTRTIHPPHQKYLERTAAQPASAGQTADSGLESGLPDECQTTSEAPLCLSCQEEGVILARCYAFKGPWNPDEACHHNRDSIKCLIKKPAFALSLDYRNSDEKFFQENAEAWIKEVHEIWDDKLNPAEKAESEVLLRALDATRKGLQNGTRFANEDATRLNEILEAKDPPREKAVQAFLKKVESDRLAGDLKLARVLAHLELTLKDVRGTRALFDKFGTMSLDGLEDE